MRKCPAAAASGPGCLADMGLPLTFQLYQAAVSFGAGTLIALVYDLLRACRQRRARGISHLADALFWLFVCGTLFFSGDAVRRRPNPNLHGLLCPTGQHQLPADVQPIDPAAVLQSLGDSVQILAFSGQAPENCLAAWEKICKNTKKVLPKSETLVYNK